MQPRQLLSVLVLSLGVLWAETAFGQSAGDPLAPLDVAVAPFSGVLPANGNLIVGDANVQNLTVNANLRVVGNSNQQGVTVNQNLLVVGNANVVGNSNLNGALAVQGASLLVGNANLIGNANVNGTLSVQSTTLLVGNANEVGTLTVNGASLLVGNANEVGTLTVNGASLLVGNANLAGAQLQLANNGNILWTGRADMFSFSDGMVAITDHAAGNTGGPVLRLGTADSNGSKIRNNGGGILNFEDGNSTGVAAQLRAGQYLNNNGTYGVFFNTSASFGNGGNSATTTLGLATNSLTAISIDSTQNVVVYGTGGLSGVNTGAKITYATVEAQTTLSGASTNLVQIPAGAMVDMVTARVTTTITSGTATSWSIGDGAALTDWGTGLAFASGTTVDGTNYVTFASPKMFPTATQVVATPNAGTFTGGVVRVVVFYHTVTAPTG